MRDFINRWVLPYRKAYAAAVCQGILTAALYYDVPWLKVAAAIATPFSVYFVKNEEPS